MKRTCGTPVPLRNPMLTSGSNPCFIPPNGACAKRIADRFVKRRFTLVLPHLARAAQIHPPANRPRLPAGAHYGHRGGHGNRSGRAAVDVAAIVARTDS